MSPQRRQAAFAQAHDTVPATPVWDGDAVMKVLTKAAHRQEAR
jgi:hypothetical protein